MKEKRYNLKTMKGCKKLLALLITILLLSSFIAQLISTDFGRVKVENISIDSRGAILAGDMYYPAGTSDKDSLPCIIVCHGGAISHTCMRGIAEELAHRGMVVLNLSAYGAGISEQPQYDEIGQGVEEYSVMETPAGNLDILDYVRTLKFVDQTRIGMAGHSMGSIRVGACAVADCGSLTLNDSMINVLCDVFGQTFTEEEIYEDADMLAKDRLTNDQMEHYLAIKAETEEKANTRLRSVMLFGAHATNVTTLQTVVVGGHEVKRNYQVNLGVLNGTWDDLSEDYCYHTKDYVKEAWFTNGEDAILESWYSLNDKECTSTVLGNFNSSSVENNSELAESINGKYSRICMVNRETHAKNFFSRATARDVVRYFEQTMNYNNGELGSAESTPLAAEKITFQLRALFNLIALFSMAFCFFPLVSMLLMSKNFKACRLGIPENIEQNLNKKKYYILAVITVVATFAIQYFVRINGSKYAKKLPHEFFPLATSFGYMLFFLLFIGLFSLLALVVVCAINKKKKGDLGLKSLNLWPGWKVVLKSIALGLIMVAFGYLSLMVINYLFNQEFRFWQIAFSTMKADYWVIAFKYALLVLPAFLVNGAMINYTVRKDIPEWKDTLITVGVNSLGIYLIFAVNLIIAAISFDGTLFSSFSASHPLLIMVPLTGYISRKMYNITKSVWVGAVANTMLVCWSAVSSLGIYNYYYGQTVLSIILGL